ncbi:neuropeptide FF receptor 2-like [Mytilus edulis]|uniref:neuropeptide FF receptor 2-like n=1 Tax=Mytilus edulis TaxID=6550 RepID=UPI0039EF1707
MNYTVILDNANESSQILQDGFPESTLANIIIFMEASTSVLLMAGNGFTIALIQKRKLLGRSTNVFIFSIAIADFLNGAVSIPSHILSITYKGEFSIYMCKCYTFVSYMSKTVVPYTVVFMSAEKAMRILCPTKEIVTVARCMFCTSLLWFFAASFNIWCVVLFTIQEDKRQTDIGSFETTSLSRCVLDQRFDYLHIPFLSIDLIVLCIFPLLTTMIILLVLARNYFTVLKERLITYFFVIKLLIALLSVIFVCHVPLEVIILLDKTFSDASPLWPVIVNCAIMISFTRGIWNLLIYGYFKHYVCRKRHLTSIRANHNINKNVFRVNSLRQRIPRRREVI